MQHRYSTYYDGKYTDVLPVEDCVRAILCRNENNENIIKRLEEENKKLKDEVYKDNELQDLQNKLKKMNENYWRGFPITEEEHNKINAWMKKHEDEAHYGKNMGYSYHFYPTCLGTCGVIKCNCGAEFEFQEIG